MKIIEEEAKKKFDIFLSKRRNNSHANLLAGRDIKSALGMSRVTGTSYKNDHRILAPPSNIRSSDDDRMIEKF